MSSTNHPRSSEHRAVAADYELSGAYSALSDEQELERLTDEVLSDPLPMRDSSMRRELCMLMQATLEVDRAVASWWHEVLDSVDPAKAKT